LRLLRPFRVRPSLPYTTLFRSVGPRSQTELNGLYGAIAKTNLVTGACMIRNTLSWLNQPMGRIAVLIAALSLFRVAAYGLYTTQDRKSTRLNSSHVKISYAVFC